LKSTKPEESEVKVGRSGRERPVSIATSTAAVDNPFGSIRLKSVNKTAEDGKAESRLSFADTVVALKKQEKIGGSTEFTPSKSTTEKKDEIPAFVGVKLKKLSEQVKNKEEEQPKKGLSKTRRLPSEDNLKKQFMESEDPPPQLQIGNQRTIQKSASFTKRITDDKK